MIIFDIIMYIFVLATLGLIIYFIMKTIKQPADVTLHVIGNENFGQKDLYEINQIIKRSNAKVAKTSNMEKIKKERIRLEVDLGLNFYLKQLYKYINLYPIWYKDTNLISNNEPFWYSTAIKPDQIHVEQLGNSDFNNLIDNYYLNKNTEILNYQFQIEGDDYNLVYIKTFEYFKSIYVYKNNIWPGDFSNFNSLFAGTCHGKVNVNSIIKNHFH